MRAVKRYFWSCLSILLIPAALFAAEAQNAFNEGVKFYKAAKYQRGGRCLQPGDQGGAEIGRGL